MNVAYQWENKVWGRVAHLFSDRIGISVLEVLKGIRCSIHYHEKRWNAFRVVSGRLLIHFFEVNEGKAVKYCSRELGPGNSVDVPPGVWHCFEVAESGDVVETYWTQDGSKVSMHDIVRLDVGGSIAENAV